MRRPTGGARARPRLAALALLLAAAASASGAPAAATPRIVSDLASGAPEARDWRARRVSLVADGEPIAALVATLAEAAALRAAIDPSIAGAVEVRIRDRRLDDALDALAATFGFDWFADRGVLHVTSTDARAAARLALGERAAADATAALARRGLLDPRFPARPTPEGDALLVEGPPAYLAALAAALAEDDGRLGAEAGSAGAEPAPEAGRSVRILRGGRLSVGPTSP